MTKFKEKYKHKNKIIHKVTGKAITVFILMILTARTKAPMNLSITSNIVSTIVLSRMLRSLENLFVSSELRVLSKKFIGAFNSLSTILSCKTVLVFRITFEKMKNEITIRRK